MSEPAIQIRRLHKSYKMGRSSLHVLRGVSLDVAAGEFVAIIGASGSGKSTLLHLAGLLDTADKGEVSLDGVDTGTLPGRLRNRMRCEDVGFVFQFYHLLPELNVLENVMLPAHVDSSITAWPSRSDEARERAAEFLDHMGLSERLTHRPNELSGGERQRVAIARAMMNRPKILLADEPTGNLDSRTGRHIMDVLKKFHTDTGQTILMVTHDQSLADQADRVLHLRDGKMTDK
jgi:ABC-type lipoprotein export system ATPase subunit